MSEPLHKPIHVKEIVHLFSEKKGDKKTFLDATFGRGGHTKKMFEFFPGIEITALDQDPDAIEYGKIAFPEEIRNKKLTLLSSNFANDDILGTATFDGILMDLGVSSPQLDTASRGFSFLHDGPLDMRMNPSQDLSAEEIVNSWDERDLADLFFNLGEVRKSFRVAKAIVTARNIQRITRTTQLADIIAKALGWKKHGYHPATECFMALRLFVNQELPNTDLGIRNLSKRLNPNGYLFVITFHSLEDRLVKRLFLAMEELGKPLFKKVIKTSKEEVAENPRSRSAKLRIFERLT